MFCKSNMVTGIPRSLITEYTLLICNGAISNYSVGEVFAYGLFLTKVDIEYQNIIMKIIKL